MVFLTALLNRVLNRLGSRVYKHDNTPVEGWITLILPSLLSN